jgi:hypothetical protein
VLLPAFLPAAASVPTGDLSLQSWLEVGYSQAILHLELTNQQRKSWKIQEAGIGNKAGNLAKKINRG